MFHVLSYLHSNPKLDEVFKSQKSLDTKSIGHRIKALIFYFTNFEKGGQKNQKQKGPKSIICLIIWNTIILHISKSTKIAEGL